MRETLALKTDNLVKQFRQQTVVDHISIQASPGEILAILGPNGAGKTTLIRILSTLLKPDGGIAEIFGYDVTKDARQVRRMIGVTGQFAALDEELTVRQNLVLFAKLNGMSSDQAKQRAEELLRMFSLEDAADKMAGQASGGMRRRLDLAASLVASPPLLFWDEPTTGLDPYIRTQIWDILKQMSANGTTIIFTTQYLEEAERLADRIAIISKGKLSALGTPDELKRQTGKTRLVLSVEEPNQIAEAAQITQRIAGEISDQDQSRHTISAAISNMEQVQDILASLKEAGISIHELSVKQPSMDEVFFEATDKSEETEPITNERRGSRCGSPRR